MDNSNNAWNILIAPNAFKNSMDAPTVAETVRVGLMESQFGGSCICFPVGDGGDGTAELIVKQRRGVRVYTQVHDPLHRPMEAPFGLIDDKKVAVIEMADASGLRLLKPNETQPLITSSFGTGELVKAALDRGVRKVIITMGGSATVDAGVGILQALGARFLNSEGHTLDPFPKALVDLDTIDLSGLDSRLTHCEIDVLCDVENTLLGPQGAAAVFGPQKGATANDVVALETILTRLALHVSRQLGVDMAGKRYGGTAGGAAGGLWALLGARLVNGIDYFLELTAFDDVLRGCNLVITGEGSIDNQTLLGKGPYGVASRAKALNKGVVGLAGVIPLEPSPQLRRYFDVLLAIGSTPQGLPEALQTTRHNLHRTAYMVGNLLALEKPTFV